MVPQKTISAPYPLVAATLISGAFSGITITIDRETDKIVATTFQKPELIIDARVVGVCHVDDDVTNQDNYIGWVAFYEDQAEFGFLVDHTN